jgi:hypothetical protein
MLEKLIQRIPFKKTIVASVGALVLGLSGCGDTTIVNNYYSSDSKTETKVEETYSADVQVETVLEVHSKDNSVDSEDTFETKQDLKEDYSEIKEDLGNQCPYFDSEVEDVEVNEKGILEVDFNAVDPEGDLVSYQLFGFHEEDQEWIDISEAEEFDPETGNIGPSQLGCHDSTEVKLKIVASDGKCEVEKEFMLTINELCDCLYDGGIQKLNCATESPCKGKQTQECVEGYWENVGDCESIKLIGHGLLPSVSGNNVAYINDNNNPITIDVSNLENGDIKTVYTFQPDEEPLMSLKLDGNKLMFSTQIGGYNNISVLDINNNEELLNFLAYDVSCTDFDQNKILCLDDDSILIVDVPNEQDIFIPNESCFGTDELYNLLMDDGFIVLPKWGCENQITVYDLNKNQLLGFTVEGEAPLISNGKMVYLDKVANFSGEKNSLLSIENINSDAEEYLAEDITQKMNGFSCMNTYGYFTGFHKDTLVCHVDDGSQYGDQLYVANLETKQFQKLSDLFPSYAFGYVSLHGKNLVFTIDEDLGDNVPIYSCELKSVWVNEPEEIEEEVVEE